ncbi:MAG: MBL fold metallo-hydrolase [Lachnospiraceae bacterium]|nr:MBL fold metallo-hydrolase [Lachnospiraceae bacterium]
MGNAIVKSFLLGMVGTNCYILTNPDTKESVIVDPADNALRISSYIDGCGYKAAAILLTHGHFDHIMAVDDLRKKYGIPVYAHEDESGTLEDPRINLTGMYGRGLSVKADSYVKDGQVLDIAGFSIKVLHTPGHTCGSCCYYIESEKLLFSGDTLFRTSVGRTDFPTGSFSAIVRSIREKIFVLPDDVRVLPGHDMETTVGFEKKYNPFVV